MLKEWLTWLRFLIDRKPSGEIDEEMQFHLEQQTDANLAAGMTPAEARRQAVLSFGSVERAREQSSEQRPGYFAETLLQDVRYAMRGFRRNPVFTFTVVVTLMLGIGATTAVFSVVDRILFRALPYAHADRLVSLGLVQSLETQEFMLGGFYYDWRDHQQPFAALTSESAVTHECDLTERDPAQLSCPKVEQNFLPTLGISPVLGRNFLPEEDRPHGPKVGLISYGLWVSRYNRDPGVLNKTIDIDGNSLQIVGVLPKDFEMPRLQPVDVLLPMAIDEAVDRRRSQGSPRRAFARLKPGVSLEQARAELEPLFNQARSLIPPDIRNDFHLKVRSLRDRQMSGVRMEAWVLLGSVVAVLLIACANVASLLLARAATRRQELAVRSALGASRARLARQALTEALLLSFAGAIAGCIFAEGLLRLFLAIAPASIPYLDKTRLDLRIVCFTILLSIVCGAFLGLVTGLQKPTGELLSGRTLTHASSASARQWLVTAQIAASMILLSGAALLLRSFRNLENQHLGMRADNTLTVSITLGEHNYNSAQQQMAFFDQVSSRLHYGPGVSLVAVSDSLPPAPNHNNRRYDSIVVSNRPSFTGANGGIVSYRWVSPEYFQALDIRILRGQGFTADEVESKDHFVVLSQQLANRLFPGANPIGERLQFEKLEDPNAPWYTVVGVASDVKDSGLTAEQVPEYYRLRRNSAEDWGGGGIWSRTSVIIVRSSLPPEEMSRWIRAQVAAVDPTLPVDIATLRQRVSKLADAPRFQTALVGFFAAMGLLLAVIGLYGVISFLVAQRRQEIGVRMAMGASRGDILRLVMGKSLRLIAWGTGIGLVISLALSRVLSSLLFSVGPRDPVTFGCVTVVLVLVAMAATAIPAKAATRVDPSVALRCD